MASLISSGPLRSPVLPMRSGALSRRAREALAGHPLSNGPTKALEDLRNEQIVEHGLTWTLGMKILSLEKHP